MPEDLEHYVRIPAGSERTRHRKHLDRSRAVELGRLAVGIHITIILQGDLRDLVRVGR
jgi:hypothetical protein